MPTTSVHLLKISLRGAQPPIWRRLEVPSELDLEQLHWAIQVAFGWEFSHLWGFETPQGRFGDGMGEDEPPASQATLGQVTPSKGQRLIYTYDFGDTWEHEILVEEITVADPEAVYPRCLKGRRACPPEDCGGMWGYAELVQILADPDHPEHDDRVDWLGLETAREFDPDAFDLEEANEALTRLNSRP